jgi:L-iditol 2-dehydrogenase
MNTLPRKTSTMGAQVLHAVGDMRYESVPIPGTGQGEVLVRVGYCGVCGSDIPRVFVNGTYHFPTIIGHEFSGTVVACGPGVSDMQPGTRVAVFPLLWCGKCAACEEGKYVQCQDYGYLGSRDDGGFAEFVVAPRANLVLVPDSVSLEEAAMTEPAAVALHALRRVEHSLLGETVVVFGAGPIGLMVAQWARAMGAFQVLVFDIIEKKLEMAREMGFDLAFNSKAVDPLAQVALLTGGAGAHVSVEGAGVPQTFVQALSVTKRGGATVVLGNPAADVTLPASLVSQLMRREVSVLGTWNSDYSAAGNDDDWRTVLAAMEAGRINLKPLITHRVALAEAFDMLVTMRDQGEFFSKVLIYPG